MNDSGIAEDNEGSFLTTERRLVLHSQILEDLRQKIKEISRTLKRHVSVPGLTLYFE